MTSLAATHGAVAALLRRRAEPLLKYNPYWSQQPRDEFGKWSKGFVHGAFSPVQKPPGSSASGKTLHNANSFVAPTIGEPGTPTGVGGAMHGQADWQGAGAKPAGAPAGSSKWTIPEQVAQAAQQAVAPPAAGMPGAKAPKVKKPPKAVGYAHPQDWKQTGPQGGSNPGGVFTDPAGKKHYVKFYENPDQGKSEVLANAIYRALGISAPESRNVIIDGKKGVESPMIEGAKPAPLGAADLKENPHIKAGFVADAFLANHDVAGAAFDNMLVDPEGKAHRIDNGGAMFYRAMGKPKADGPFPFVPNDVPEIDSMRDPSKAKQAGHIFNGLSNAEMMAQAKALVKNLPDEKIAALVAAAGFTGDDAEKYVKTLTGRRNALAQRFLSAAEENAPPTTEGLAAQGMNAPAPIEPEPPKLDPASAAAIDPKHPYPDMLSLDPGLKSYAVAEVAHWASENPAGHAKAVALAKKPKVLDKILSGTYHDKDIATVLADVAAKASNAKVHAVANPDGTFSVKKGTPPTPQPAAKAAPGTPEMHAAITAALSNAAIQPHVNTNAILSQWIHKGPQGMMVQAGLTDPSFAKGLLTQHFPDVTMASAAQSMLEEMAGSGIKIAEDGEGFKLALDAHGTKQQLHSYPFEWTGAQQGLPNPTAVAMQSDASGYPKYLGSAPESYEQAQAKIKAQTQMGNSVIADWMKQYSDKKFGANDDSDAQSEWSPNKKKFTLAELEEAGANTTDGIPYSTTWLPGIEAKGSTQQIADAQNAILANPGYLAHLKDTNYEKQSHAYIAGKLLQMATGQKFKPLEESDGGGMWTLKPDGPAPEPESASPPMVNADGKLNPHGVMAHHAELASQSKPITDALETKKAATSKLLQQLSAHAKTAHGLNAILSTTFTKYNVALAAAKAVKDATGHYTKVSAHGGFHVETSAVPLKVQAASTGLPTYVKHPALGGKLMPPAAVAAAPVKPVAPTLDVPPPPFESEAAKQFKANTGPLKPGAPSAGIVENPTKLPSGITRDMAITTNPEAQKSHIAQLEAKGHVDAASWLDDHYAAMNAEPENPHVKDSKITPGGMVGLPHPLRTASQIISDLHQNGALRPKGLSDWMLHATSPAERESAIKQISAPGDIKAKSAAAWLEQHYHGRDEAQLPADQHFYTPQMAAAAGLPEHAHPSFAQSTPPKPLAPSTAYHFHSFDGNDHAATNVPDPSNQMAPSYAGSRVPQPANATHLTIPKGATFGEARALASKSAASAIAKFAKTQPTVTDPLGDMPAEGVHKDSIHTFKLTQQDFPAMLQAARASLPSHEALVAMATTQGGRAPLRAIAASVAGPILAHYGVSASDYKTIADSIKEWTSSTKGANPDSASGNRLRVMSNMLRGRRPDENVFRDGEFATLDPKKARGFAKRVPQSSFRAFLAHKAVTQAMFERYVDPKTGTATLERGIDASVCKSMAGKTAAQGLFKGDLGKSVQSHELALGGYSIKADIANQFGGEGSGGVLVRAVKPEEVWHGQFLSPSHNATYDREAEIFVSSNGGGPHFTIGGKAGAKAGANYLTTSTGAANPQMARTFATLAGMWKSSSLDLDEQPPFIPNTPEGWYADAPEGWTPTPEAMAAFRAAFTDHRGVFNFYPDADAGLRDNPTCAPRPPVPA